MTQNPAPRRARPLPVGPRFLAAVIDFIVLAIPQAIAYILIAAPQVSRVESYYQRHPKQGIAAAVAHTPGYAASNLHFFIVAEALTAAYLIGGYLAFSGTLGKRLLGLRVTRVDGSPLRVRDAVLRSLPFWVPWLLPAVGLYLNFFEFVGGSILLLFRPDHRAPEDMLGNSMVVWREQEGRSLGDIVAAPSISSPPPAQPGSVHGGHLPGWEPVSPEDPVFTPAGSDAPEPNDRPQEEEESR